MYKREAQSKLSEGRRDRGQGYLRAGRGAAGHHAYERNAGDEQDDGRHVGLQHAVYELLVFRQRLDDRGKAVDARYCPDRGQR